MITSPGSRGGWVFRRLVRRRVCVCIYVRTRTYACVCPGSSRAQRRASFLLRSSTSRLTHSLTAAWWLGGLGGLAAVEMRGGLEGLDGRGNVEASKTLSSSSHPVLVLVSTRGGSFSPIGSFYWREAMESS